MTNRRDLTHIAIGCTLAASAVGIYQLGRASAQNIPSMPTMFYGVSLDENGAAVTGTRDLRVRLFDGEMGGAQLCETLANSTTVTQGRARIALSETCRTAVQQNANVWVELAVGGNVVGARSRIGAVPYAVEAQRANDLTATANSRVRRPECPDGYTQDTTVASFVVCRRPIAAGAFDEVVRVGSGAAAFWIDRYEASVWQNADGSGTQHGATARDYPPGFPNVGPSSLNSALYGISRSGVRPSGHLSWYQAQMACHVSGKRLPSNSEWTVAATGTSDPGANNGGGGACLTSGSASRNTGLGTACVSVWGAQDMIGNVDEVVEEWIAAPEVSGVTTGSWGTSDFAGDLTYWIGSRALDNAEVLQRVPSTVTRGGWWQIGASAGLGAYAMGASPSRNNGGAHFGFRCVIPRP